MSLENVLRCLPALHRCFTFDLPPARCADECCAVCRTCRTATRCDLPLSTRPGPVLCTALCHALHKALHGCSPTPCGDSGGKHQPSLPASQPAAAHMQYA